MNFTNLNNQVFWALKAQTKECYYSISSSWRCWKFWFNKETGIAIIKHNSFTQNDAWSVVAISRKDNDIYLLDEPWYNVKDEDILHYVDMIQQW